jgi:hypothetical protein
MDQILRSDGHLSGSYLEWPQDVGRRRPVSVSMFPPGRRRRSPPKATTHPPGPSIGEFWQISGSTVARSSPGTDGQATGYAAFLGLDLQHHKAVVLCSDVAGGH